VDLERTDDSEEGFVSIIRVDRISELGTTLVVELPFQEDLFTVRLEACLPYDLGRLKSLVTLKMEATCSSETSVLTGATRRHISEDNILIKNCVFCDVTPCGSCKNRRF
jgi:hypothetical protein